MGKSPAVQCAYGYQDTSFLAAGGVSGVRRLCEDFYELMSTLPEAAHIRSMHEDSLEVMIDKLTLFLSMWLGGPSTYREKYSSFGMPRAHQHLVINEAERDAWLLCMDQAVGNQPFDDNFKTYFKKQIRFPANMITKVAKSE
jgi:hemoglobin